MLKILYQLYRKCSLIIKKQSYCSLSTTFAIIVHSMTLNSCCSLCCCSIIILIIFSCFFASNPISSSPSASSPLEHLPFPLSSFSNYPVCPQLNLAFFIDPLPPSVLFLFYVSENLSIAFLISSATILSFTFPLTSF